jgi:hypothetical protein
MDTTCPRCGAAMSCNPGQGCWCEKLPRRPMPERAEACLCPKCLAEETTAEGHLPVGGRA